MTGRQVKKLRKSLGLDQFAFATVLGVHVSTIYRWEARDAEDVKMDPLQEQIMKRLRARVTEQPQGSRDLGDAIVKGLLAGGALVGLLALLKLLLEDEGDES